VDFQEIQPICAEHPTINALTTVVDKEVHLSGLSGSAKAVIIASLFRKKGGMFLCILNDLEDAGYFYNDLMQLLNGNDVYFFPSAYHRHIKYGHTDPSFPRWYVHVYADKR
jgi:transcription-repair coupling factor (superfamily II helicase)